METGIKPLKHGKLVMFCLWCKILPAFFLMPGRRCKPYVLEIYGGRLGPTTGKPFKARKKYERVGGTKTKLPQKQDFLKVTLFNDKLNNEIRADAAPYTPYNETGEKK